MSLYTDPHFWLNGDQTQNFGDFLTRYFMEKLFLPSGIEAGGVFIVGSCISDYHVKIHDRPELDKKPILFWGCGLREATGLSETARKKCRFLSVRGPLTRSLLRLGDVVPLGDPGLLMPALYSPQQLPNLAGTKLLVPHFHDTRSDEYLKQLSGCNAVLRPNISNDLRSIETFVDYLFSVDFVLCGSMHAAIVAAAYGKPFGFWDAGYIDLPFKWDDFAQSVGIKCQFIAHVSEAMDFFDHSIKDKLSLPMLWPLLVVAPYVVRPDIFAKVIEMDFRKFGSSIFDRPPTEPTAREIRVNLENVRDQIKILEERSMSVVRLQEVLAARDGDIGSLRRSLMEHEEQVKHLNGRISLLNECLSSMKKSRSWSITRPLREAKRWVVSPRSQIKRYAKFSLRIVKRIYSALPIDGQTRSTHRQWLARRFPRILLASGINPNAVQFMRNFAFRAVNAADIRIPLTSSPRVSIIIPVYGKLDYTLRCLASIEVHLPLAQFEVIVIDDCSQDNSWETLKKVEGIRLIRNEKNQGFIRTCNIGAKEAKGEFLYFLNNDTEVTDGWLDELLRTFVEFPGTGLVGSKLMYPDGRLQEAGGIIWQDGSAWNFGRFQDPELPVYNYAREVDYCSGASIMVPKSLFEELGGFDEHYLPAYCEDSDLALKIRDRGYRVIYQPMSKVIHYEGITSGSDTTQGTKAYQVENSKKLFERWNQRLDLHEQPMNNVDKAKDRRATRRVLVLDHCTPTPDQDAGSVTIFNFLLLLREMDFQVTFIPEDNFLNVPKYTWDLQRLGIEMLYAPHVTSVEQHVRECGARYDLVFLIRPSVVERHLNVIRAYCPKAKALYHMHDLHYLRLSREAELKGDIALRKVAQGMKYRELTGLCNVDATIVHSTDELEILRPLLPDAQLHLFPLILHISGRSSTFHERKDIVFVGGYQHVPNVDAVLYFVKEVMPLLREKLPGVRFYVVGSKPPPEIQALAAEDVIITGFVEDLTTLLNKMRLSVAPLRYGAGIKGKIGTAMAVGLPVVATPLAAEGMLLNDGENVLVADGPQDFAKAVCKLYQDEVMWERISDNGLLFAEKAWGAESGWKNLAKILASLNMAVNRADHSLSLYSDAKSCLEDISLQAIGSAGTREDFLRILESPLLKRIEKIEKILLSQAATEEFALQGLCVACSAKSSFLVDVHCGGQRLQQGWIPNWRERLVCPYCQMNNRQRLIAALIKDELDACEGKSVYLMEQVTPIFQWTAKTFDKHNVVGSEYLGYEYTGGSIVNDIRHEDVEQLSFQEGQFDLIVSNDVFEHVPNPEKAFKECARVLRPGGRLVATIPFHRDSDISVVRAKLVDGKVEHICPPVFHGNPISSEGALVFTDFGWDVLKTMARAGFSDVALDVYASEEYGHLGGGQIVFRCIR